MMYYLMFLLLFFLPGLCLVYLLNIRKFTFLLSFSLSYALLILTLVTLVFLRSPTWWWDALVSSEVALLAGWAGIRFWCRRGQEPVRRGIFNFTRLRIYYREYLVVAGLMAVLAGYLGYAGPYTEIPADAWAHLERIQAAVKSLQAGHFSSRVVAWRAGLDQGHYWYMLPAWISQRCGTDMPSLLWGLTLTNVLTFVLGYFYFALYVFRGLRIARAAKYAMAACAALWAAAATGFSVFAYIRYYAFAPAILNHVLFLAVMALWLSYLRRRAWLASELLLIPCIFLAMKLIHSQESLFAVCLAFAILICEFWRTHYRRVADPRRLKIAVLFVAGAGAYGALYWLLHDRAICRPPEPFLVPIQQCIPFLRQMYIAPPFGQFYEALGLWGVLVYVLFFIRFRDFRGNVYVMAGMFLPLLTIFNPVTIDMFLRQGVYSAIFYRMAYALPLPLVAGFVAVAAARGLLRKRTAADTRRPGILPGWPSWSNRRLWAGLVLLGLIGFMFPIHTPFLEAPFSRLFTLRRMAPANDVHLWADLLEYLSGFQGKHIVTDNITGYVINGFTSNDPHVEWFHHTEFSGWLASEDPAMLAKLKLDPKHEWLLVINERDGGFSLNGAISGHWPGDVLNVSRYYSPAMKQYVAEHPEIFRPIWQADRIRVYEVMK